MLYELINDYYSIIGDWIQEVRQQKHNYDNSTLPDEFERHFLSLMERMIFFDSVWTTMTERMKEMLKGVLGYANQVKFNINHNFPLDLIDEADQEWSSIPMMPLLEELYKKKDYHHIFTLMPNSSEAYELYHDTLLELEKAGERC